MLNIKKITDDMISIDIEEDLNPLEEGLQPIEEGL